MNKTCVCVATMVISMIVGCLAIAEDGVVSSTMASLEDSNWVVALDADNVGREQAWWTAPRPEAVSIRVPGILQEALPGCHGVVWYWTEFASPLNPYEGGRCLLRFQAVDYLADVWLNGVHVGMHEGGETPFSFDITDALTGMHHEQMAVRVLNPKAEPIDGIVLAETPHRNKAASGISVGGSYNSGGIIAPVEVFWVPALRIEDVYIRPDWKTGLVRVQSTVHNSGAASVEGQFRFVVAPALDGRPIAALALKQDVPTGSSTLECELKVENHRLWQLDDPHLYRLSSSVAPVADGAVQQRHENHTRFGFRELRVEKGFFRLNGKRIFLKSSHTGNHCPIGAILPPDSAPDLLRKDLIYAKACGFNMVRFIAGMAYPYQLDICDEIGLMAYEENMASWLLADSPAMARRFDDSLREMVMRDRNHPSLVIFGLMNEMREEPLVRHAVSSLELLRSLDDSRLIVLQSGRWDGLYDIGSVSNPGSSQWEHVWGVEDPSYVGKAGNGPWGGYFEGAGDAHVYPSTPHTPDIEAGIRNLGKNSKPVFLSEYGIGSLMNAIRELRMYEQHGANPDWDDFKFFKQTEEKLTAAWKLYGMTGVYAFPEDMLRDSQRLHGRQRLLGFNLIRSNPNICGYNLTGLLDHGYTGEGLWTFWREFKPGLMDVLQDGWAKLRWCLFASPMHGYTERPIKLEAVLANEDVLAPGAYPVLLRVLGPDGLVWEERREVVVPDAEEAPFAIPVFEGDVFVSGPTGQYTFAVALEEGGAPAGGRLHFYLTQPSSEMSPATAVVTGLDARVTEWLNKKGVTTLPVESAASDQCQTILIGDWNQSLADAAAKTALLRRAAQGSVAVFLSPAAFKQGDNPVGWLPLKNKGGLTYFSDWLYHKECVAKQHPFFNGLQPRGVMDWDYYGPVITNAFFEGQDPPDDAAAAAFAVCHSSRPDGFAAGVMLGVYAFGAGKIVLNTFAILDNLDVHPAADALLLNIIEYAEKTSGQPLAPLPNDIDALLNELGR